jgi:hypothetical protein
MVVPEQLRRAFSLSTPYAEPFGTTILRSRGLTWSTVITPQATEPTIAALISRSSRKKTERSLTKGLRMLRILCRTEACTIFLAWMVEWLMLIRLAHEQRFTIWIRSSGTSNTAVPAFGLLIACSRRDRRGECSAMTSHVENEQMARLIKYKKDDITYIQSITVRSSWILFISNFHELFFFFKKLRRRTNGLALKLRKMEDIRSRLNGSADRRNFVMADVQHSIFFTPLQYQQVSHPRNRNGRKQIF